MAHLIERGLSGKFAEQSEKFLREMGFYNAGCISSEVSAWTSGSIILYLPVDTFVLNHHQLFNLIYEKGYNVGYNGAMKELRTSVMSKLESVIFDNEKS